MFILAVYLFKPLYKEKYMKMALLGEMGCDAFFVVFGFLTNLVGAVKCNDDSWHRHFACFGETEAAIAFGFISTFLHILSIVLTLFHLRVKK